MFCKNCGKELAESAKFCTKCGTKQDVKQETKEEVKQQPPVEKTEKEAKAEARVEAVAETVSKSISSAKEKISDAVKSVNNEETRAAVKETAENVSKSIDSAKEKISDAVKSINNEETKAAVKETIDATKEKVDEIGEFAEAAGQKVAGDLGAKITEKTGIKKPFKFLLPIAAVLMCIGVYFGFFHNSDPFVGTWAEEKYKVNDNLKICEITKNGDAYIINFYNGNYVESKSIANVKDVEEFSKKFSRKFPGFSLYSVRWYNKEKQIQIVKTGLQAPRPIYDYKYDWKKDSANIGLVGLRNKNIMTTKNINMIFNDKTKMIQLDGYWKNCQMVKISDDEIKKFKESRKNNIKMKLADDFKKRDENYAKYYEGLEKFIQTGEDTFDTSGYSIISDQMYLAKLGKIEFVDGTIPAK